MIAVKIDNPRPTSSKSERIGNVIDYILNPRDKNSSQLKCVYSNSRNFIASTQKGQAVEMISLANEAARSKDPLNHYVLSWQENERIEPAQVDEAIDIFLKTLKLEDHQIIYALHDDSDNHHVHIAINRVHPDSLKPIEINKGFDIEACLQAVALIEHAQGWKREDNARYLVNESGNTERNTSYISKENRAQIGNNLRQIEKRTGVKSATRVAQEVVESLINSDIKSWDQFHKALSDNNMRYVKSGFGAAILVGDVAVRASKSSTQATLEKLTKKFGEFTESKEKETSKYAPVPVDNNELLSRYNSYASSTKKERKKNIFKLKAKQEEEKNALKINQKNYRDEAIKGDWSNQGAVLNALRSVISEQQKQDREELKNKHKKESESLNKSGKVLSYEEWISSEKIASSLHDLSKNNGKAIKEKIEERLISSLEDDEESGMSM